MNHIVYQCAYIPVVIPSKSMTAICASPFAVMSPMLSDERAKDLYLRMQSYKKYMKIYKYVNE